MEDRLLTVKEAAALLHISDRKLWSLTQCGDVKVVRLGRSVRYSRQALAEFVQGLEAESLIPTSGNLIRSQV